MFEVLVCSIVILGGFTIVFTMGVMCGLVIFFSEQEKSDGYQENEEGKMIGSRRVCQIECSGMPPTFPALSNWKFVGDLLYPLWEAYCNPDDLYGDLNDAYARLSTYEHDAARPYVYRVKEVYAIEGVSGP